MIGRFYVKLFLLGERKEGRLAKLDQLGMENRA